MIVNMSEWNQSDWTLVSDCMAFRFVVGSVLTGALCLTGFAANTLCFMVMWREKHSLSMSLLLQGAVVADTAVLWLLFIGDSLPALEYILPLLQGCSIACHSITVVTTPMLFFAQTCVVWLALAVAAMRYVALCKPTFSTVLCSVQCARRLLTVIVIASVVLAIPASFDTNLTTQVQAITNKTHVQVSSQDHWYHVLYWNIATTSMAYAIPLLCIMYIAGKLTIVLRSLRNLPRSLAAEYASQNSHLTHMILSMLVIITICYLPTVTLTVVRWTDRQMDMCGTMQYYLHGISRLFIAINSSTKLFVFCLFVNTFRANLCMHVHGQHVSKNGENYSVFGGVYRCGNDMSEMTLISQTESRT